MLQYFYILTKIQIQIVLYCKNQTRMVFRDENVLFMEKASAIYAQNITNRNKRNFTLFEFH